METDQENQPNLTKSYILYLSRDFSKFKMIINWILHKSYSFIFLLYSYSEFESEANSKVWVE